jgi:tetratricopeptide (TPR) repeat protein
MHSPNPTALKAVVACLLSALFTPTLIAQRLPPSPSSASPKPTPQIETAPDYSQEALVIEHMKTAYRFEKNGTGQHELVVRVKVQSEAALNQFGQLVFPYVSANENLDFNHIRVRKANGTTVAASATDIQDLTAPISREAPVYTDVRQKHVTVPGLRPGDTLEYHAVWKMHTPLAANHFWLSHDFIKRDAIVLDEQLEVNVPAESAVKLKTEKGFDPAVRELEGRRVYMWKHSVLKRVEEQDDDKEAARRRKEELEDPRSAMVQLTTFNSWGEVGQWYADLERDRTAPDEKIRAKVAELIRDRKTDQEKIEALYEFVAKNFRYVSLSLGQGRYQPHAATEVLANQYGDCKDKHTLLASMLNAAGLRAYPALMNSSRKIDPDVPSPGQFDHVISAIPLGNETFWADTTSEVAPFRLLSPSLRDKKALLIPVNATARLENTPASPPFVSSEVAEIEAQISELGKLNGQARLVLRGDAEMGFRMAFRRTPKSQWKELGFFLASAIGVRGGEVTDIKTSDIEALSVPFEISFKVTSEDFMDWSAKKLTLSLPLPDVTLREVAAEKEEEAKPIQIGVPININYRLKLSLPAKYQVRLPVPLKVNRDYATYSSVYSLQENVVQAERTYQSRLHELPPARTPDYRAFVAAARADASQTLSLETTNVADASSVPDSVKTDDLMSAAEAAAKNNNYPLVESLLQRVLEKEPKHKTARRQLGYALFAQRKLDDAVKVLREQTTLSPFDDFAFTMLGQALWAQQNYAEAERAFRKQLEIAPLDKWARGNLGLMLVEWRKYKEAIPELEQAISLNEEQEANYQVALGRAYLSIGESEKGVAAFDRAVKLSPGQSTWNNVAYYFATNKVQLDRAQQYAESAVTEASTRLRNAELPSLTPQDLQNVSALAAYWDTLGWVLFQKGDIDNAEKYIAAAWRLAEHGEVGYHLGQILEKRGKTSDAIRIYALAAYASRTVPEALESLQRLVGKDKSLEAMNKGAMESINARTINIGPATVNVKGATEARFFVALVPGQNGRAQVADVKFISGDEKLRPLANQLKSGNFGPVFPDDKVTKIIRRGTLSCIGKDNVCSFIMVSPDYMLLD